MEQLNRSRWSLLSGFLFVALWLAATLFTGPIEYLPAADDILTNFRSGMARISYASYFGVVSAFFLIWFSGSLREFLKTVGKKAGALAEIAFGGGVAAGILAMLAFSAVRAVAERMETAAGAGPDSATALIDLSGQLNGLALPVAFAVLITASGLAVLRTGCLPAWFGWLSVFLGLTLLSPLIYLVMPLGLLWTAGLSVWLFARVKPGVES